MFGKSIRTSDAAGEPDGAAARPVRRINTEKFAGGRGSTTAAARSEKRSTGRIKTTALRCDFGQVTDLSAGGVKAHSKKRPAIQVGEKRTITLTAEEESVEVEATCVWLRVDDACEFDIGLRLDGVDAQTRRRLMGLATTAQATEGLTRGWTPMFRTA